MDVTVIEYIDEDGESPFERWFSRLNSQSASKVATALYRMEMGNFSNVKNIGAGVSEYKINFGPGYRIYFGKEGTTLVVLLGGGTKKRQSKDIDDAKILWKTYKQRKRKGEK